MAASGGDGIPSNGCRQEGFSGDVSIKKEVEKQGKRAVPAFMTEAEEAEWWCRNRDAHGKQLLSAVQSGEAQVVTKEKLLARLAASKRSPAPVVALRIPAADLALARKQANRKDSRIKPASNRCYMKRLPSSKSEGPGSR